MITAGVCLLSGISWVFLVGRLRASCLDAVSRDRSDADSSRSCLVRSYQIRVTGIFASGIASVRGKGCVEMHHMSRYTQICVRALPGTSHIRDKQGCCRLLSEQTCPIRQFPLTQKLCRVKSRSSSPMGSSRSATHFAIRPPHAAALARNFFHHYVHHSPTPVSSTVGDVLMLARAKPNPILITGSLHFAGEVLADLRGEPAAFEECAQ